MMYIPKPTYGLQKNGIDKGLCIKGLKVFNTFTNTDKFYRDSKLINHTDLPTQAAYSLLLVIKKNWIKKICLRLKKNLKNYWDNNTTQPPLAEPSSLVKIKPVTPTTCPKTKETSLTAYRKLIWNCKETVITNTEIEKS